MLAENAYLNIIRALNFQIDLFHRKKKIEKSTTNAR